MTLEPVSAAVESAGRERNATSFMLLSDSERATGYLHSGSSSALLGTSRSDAEFMQ
jgi:hypothetical protein